MDKVFRVQLNINEVVRAETEEQAIEIVAEMYEMAKYDVKDWETCSMSHLDRAERLDIKMREAFNLIEGIALSQIEKENK